MHTDNDPGKKGNIGVDLEDEGHEKDLQWLIDMDLSEPEETLFTVKDNEYRDEGLSAFEAEVAGRPLVRGNDGGDDLANYVGEEIVISSEGASDIYSEKGSDAEADAQESRPESMAIDYSLGRRTGSAESHQSVDEGADILGLQTDDDIGEKYLTIKRVKGAAEQSVEESDSAVETAAPIAEEAEESPENNDAIILEAEEVTPAMAPGPDLSEMIDNSLDQVDEEVVGEMLLDDELVDEMVAEAPEDVADSQSADPLEGAGSLIEAAQRLTSGEDGHEALEAANDSSELQLDDSLTFDLEQEFDDFTDDEAFELPEEVEALAEDDESIEVASVVPSVLEALDSQVGSRAQSLGMTADAVRIDVMMGLDEESVGTCYSEGYVPLSALQTELPQAVEGVSDDQAGVIFVRLSSSVDQHNWNHLFSESFESPAIDGEVEEDFGAALDSIDDLVADDASFGGEDILETAMDESEDDIFGADFADDLGDDFAAEFVSEDDSEADIDSLFSELSVEADEEFSAESDAEADDLTLSDADEPVLEEPEVLDEQVFAEADSFADVDEADASIDVEFDAELDAEVQVEASEVPQDEAVSAEEVAPANESASNADATTLAAMIGEIDDSNPDWYVPEAIKFNFTTQSNAEIFADFLDAFIEEGSAEVEKLENLVGDWEKDVSVDELYADVCRTLHTIKGIAKGVGLQRMGTLVHNFETLLERLPRPEEGEETLYFRVVNIWLDAVVRGIEHITGEREDIASELPQVGKSRVVSAEPEPADEVLEVSETEAEPVSVEPAVVEAVEVEPEQTEDSPQVDQPRADAQLSMLAALEKKRDKQLADEGAKVLAAQQSVRMTSEKLDLLLNLASQAQQLGVRASQNTTRSKRSSSELQGRLSSVRTHINKIADRALFNVNARAGGTSAEMDALEMDQYSELQEAASILREGVEDLSDLIDVVSRQNAQIEALLKQQSSVISSISSSIQGARVVPVSRLMPGLRRIVRTVSTDLGKSVTFNVINETGALDRDHYARLQTVLEHMVRNALDHGIESADDRLAAGKPMGGRITIDVRKSGGDYLIRLSDDGKGIDADAIRQKAYEKGLDVDVDELSDDEAIRLIFHKGFSTASELSEISGRGVGMDIVLSELQQIGGDISIQSAVGLGTSFEVRIPSNVSVNGALLVAAADQSYAIPLNGLVAVEQVPVAEFFSAIEEGRSLKLFDLECEPAYLGTLCHSIPIPDRTFWEGFVPVIIAGEHDRHMAIAIDNVEEALELVVRSLGSQFTSVPGVAGAATTSDGEALVALDLNLLVGSIGADGVAAVGKVEQEERQSLLALVVDDSRTQRMVATSQLESVGVETVTAENGLVAIDLLNATHRLPDVVLLDVEMPVKDGIETLREIRKSRRYGQLPVIMVTSRTGAKHRALAKEAGCNAYMGKPFNFQALLEQISELTGHVVERS